MTVAAAAVATTSKQKLKFLQTYQKQLFPQPSTRSSIKTFYSKCLKKKVPQNLLLENITNAKLLNQCNQDVILHHDIICSKIVKNIIHFEDIQFLKFRDILYDIFIYNLDITDCIWYILSTLVEQKRIKKEHLSKVLIKTYCFFQYYNNNYRPIYHLENYLYYLTKLIHNF